MPTLMQCHCGHEIFTHPLLPGARGTRDNANKMDPPHRYETWYKEVNGVCPRCHRVMPKPETYYATMQCDVAAVEMSLAKKLELATRYKGGKRVCYP